MCPIYITENYEITSHKSLFEIIKMFHAKKNFCVSELTVAQQQWLEQH